ncbi:kynurenine--oxoglutarate transaminase 1 isoform X2 [Capricornis sumatraensis]|uniref:kynurenine--oxoglutarate transaminase 1 isoform X2 n=1 Tax=Capricornis sumatraensis TaxID=34865 RepID=UPI0036047465
MGQVRGFREVYGRVQQEAAAITVTLFRSPASCCSSSPAPPESNFNLMEFSLCPKMCGVRAGRWASPGWWRGEDPGAERLEEPCPSPPPGGCGHRAVASWGEPRLTLHLLCLQLTPCLLCCLQLTMAKRLQARRLDGIDQNPWVEFVKLASEEADVVNLGQGFPDFSPPEFAVEAFQHATSGDFMLNQYTKAFVIIVEPFFDCYEPMTLMAGGRPVFVSLKPSPTQKGEPDSSSNWQLDPMELASKFTSRTKAFILNTPNNPLGKVFSREELELVASLCQQHDVVCITDEVYQWLVFDGFQHISIASLPGMWERTLTIGSAGKTFSVTGWKVGWVLGPDSLMKHLRTVHQNSIYHCATQCQAAVAQSFEREQLHFGQPSSYFVQFPQYIQRCRDHMIQSLQSVGLRPVIPQGSYFLITDISDFKNKMPDLPGAADEPYDRRFVKWMIKNKGLMAIPVSTFFSVPHQKFFDHYIRFCFVKDESTLRAMDQKLQKWKAELMP